MSRGTDSPDHAGVTGETLLTAEFDPAIARHGTIYVTLILIATLVGILVIPVWLPLSRWYFREYMRRVSARLTSQAIVISKGVFFRTEATIPLDRITDVRLHDGPLMRYCNLRGLRIETAGQSGPQASSEGNLVGIIGAEKMRDAILKQRQLVVDAVASTEAAAPSSGDPRVLVEIRDILARIEAKLHSD